MLRYHILSLLACFILVAALAACSETPDQSSDGDADQDADSALDGDKLDGDAPDGDIVMDGDIETDGDALDGDSTDSDQEIYIPPDPDCTGCEDFPGLYCVSEIRKDNCPSFITDEDLEMANGVQVEILTPENKTCGYEAWVRSGVADPPTFAVARFADCHFTMIAFSNGPDAIDDPPPLPGSWNPETGEIVLQLGATCGYTFTKDACLLADGDEEDEEDSEPYPDGDLDNEADAEIEAETELEAESDLETEAERDESSEISME